MLNAVSETAIYTLMSRVESYNSNDGLIDDPVGQVLLKSLMKKLSEAELRRVYGHRVPESLKYYVVLRAIKYDTCVRDFLQAYPDGLVVSLGSGFDTRYWRTDLSPSQYVELDLAEVVELKESMYGQNMPYPVFRQSVLDESWIEDILRIQDRHILFIAEGLLMYLPEEAVLALFETLSTRFKVSQILFEVVHKKYTQGLYKRLVVMKMKKRMGSDAGSAYGYGVYGAAEINEYHPNLKVVEEWSYLEDHRVKPKILSCLKRFKTFTRSQWTMRAEIGEMDE